jgi:outer membrane protein OmpA-like peptidoglycan-associated protein
MGTVFASKLIRNSTNECYLSYDMYGVTEFPKERSGGSMTKNRKYHLALVLLAALVIMLAPTAYAQGSGNSAQGLAQADTIKVPVGQKMTVEGVVLSRESDRLVIRTFDGGLYSVSLASTSVKERKKNFFRGAKVYSYDDLIPGLPVEVKGVGDSSGSLAANEIRLRNDDLKVAQTMDTRVIPIEDSLKETQARLDESETNAQRLSGQVRELTAITDVVRDSAKAAQESADNAMSEANKAESLANEANDGVRVTNERITSLDNYEVKDVITVHFIAGSTALSEQDKLELDGIAQQATAERGYFIEVTGFASSDGNEEYNRRLSQGRAEAVTRYLVENHSIPLRRFIMPMGYGENKPVGDNGTRQGREQNRRVEVRMLVSKALSSN